MRKARGALDHPDAKTLIGETLDRAAGAGRVRVRSAADK